jgi:FlaA1/EpsC-like NDP-sugar epimerase
MDPRASQLSIQYTDPKTARGPALVARLRRYRPLIAYSLFALATALALVLAFAARFELAIPARYLDALPGYIAVFVLVRLTVARTLRLLIGRWRFAGVDDAVRLATASTLSSVVFVVVARGFGVFPGFPYTVAAIEWALFTLGVGGSWLAYRRVVELLGARQTRLGSRERRLVIIGAGEAGNLLAHEMHRMPGRYALVGFLDDDPLKQGTRVQGVEVLGPVSRGPELLATAAVDEVIVAVPSASPADLRRMLEALEPLELPFKVVPGIQAVLGGGLNLSHIRPMRLEDLLGREPVTLELPRLREDLGGKVVLVTGGAGSIGSELARQIAANRPSRLVLLDQAESPLYFVDLELRQSYPDLELEPVVADVLDLARVREVFESLRPDVVLHAAAYKHVPLMERNPREAVRNNVLGTWHVAESAGIVGVDRLVLISTDKAADPSSVMGATKRAAELLLTHLHGAHPGTQYTAVRFGNVLGSNGSVIPLFRRQIEEGGPVTITHPDVTRFFMTIPEAVQLVLQAGMLPEARGRIAMLEMGEPVKIADLARNLVRLSGLRPEVDIPFVYTGLRPGEKLHETLAGVGEAVVSTSLPEVNILKGNPRPEQVAEVLAWVERMTSGSLDHDGARALLAGILGPNALEPGEPVDALIR